MGRGMLRLFAGLSLLSLLAACGGGDRAPTRPETPQLQVTTIEVSPSSAELDALGATLDFEATAKDRNGNTVSGVSFSWSVSPDSVASVDGDGTVTARAEGRATVEATASGVTGSAELTVDQQASRLELVSGDGQSGLADSTLTDSLTVRAVDASGNAVPATVVSWTVTEGGGALVAADDTTDQDGLSAARWRLGATFEARRRLRACGRTATPARRSRPRCPSTPSC